MAEAVEAVIHDKKKVNKQKLKYCEMEVFCDTKIVDSESENELHGFGSLNLED